MKKKIGYLVFCLFALAILATGSSVPAEPFMELEGPLMEINADKGFIVVNEKILYIGSPDALENAPESSIKLESLKKDQWVHVEVELGRDRLWATSLKVINRPTK